VTVNFHQAAKLTHTTFLKRLVAVIDANKNTFSLSSHHNPLRDMSGHKKKVS
jgi:hypothetical protein